MVRACLGFRVAHPTRARNHATKKDPPQKNSYTSINNGVYRCGFATTQEAYDAAFDDLAAALGRLEATLAKQRYVAGDGAALTEGACSAGACASVKGRPLFLFETH